MSSVKLAILVASGLILVRIFVAQRRADARATRNGRLLLGALALLAVASHYRFSPTFFATAVTESDVFHYYLGGKYYAELGYVRLYACAVVADAESVGPPAFSDVRRVRRLDTYAFISRAEALREATACHERFSVERWTAFKEDVRRLGNAVPTGQRQWMLTDRGANATTTWQLFGGLLARIVPAHRVKLLCLVDVVLMGAALFGVRRAFGPVAANSALIFIAACFSSRWPVIGTSLCRYDWLAASLAGLCLLRRRRPAAAAVLFGLASLLRVYPVFFVAGLALKACAEWVATRRLNRSHLAFGASFAATAVLLLGVGVAAFGPARLRESITKLERHADADTMSKQRVGAAVAAAWRPGGGWNAKKQRVASERAALLGLAALVALAFAFVARARDDEEAAAHGFVLLFFATYASYYYWTLLVLPLIVLIARGTVAGLCGALLLIASNVLALGLYVLGVERAALTTLLSLALGVSAVQVLWGMRASAPIR